MFFGWWVRGSVWKTKRNKKSFTSGFSFFLSPPRAVGHPARVCACARLAQPLLPKRATPLNQKAFCFSFFSHTQSHHGAPLRPRRPQRGRHPVHHHGGDADPAGAWREGGWERWKGKGCEAPLNPRAPMREAAVSRPRIGPVGPAPRAPRQCLFLGGARSVVCLHCVDGPK